MQEKPKSNSVVTHRRREDGALIFTVKDVGELVFDKTKASAQNRAWAEDHGWIQRVSDAAAISRDTKTGLPATPQAKFDAMRKLVEFYETGTLEWKMAGGGGAGVSAERQWLLRALGEIYPARSAEELKAWVDKRTAQERAALAATGPIKAKIDGYRSEVGKGLDAEALLGELEADGSEEAEQA